MNATRLKTGIVAAFLSMATMAWAGDDCGNHYILEPLCAPWVPPDSPVPEPNPAIPRGSVTLKLADGARIVGGYASFPGADDRGYSQAVWKFNADGTPDATFNGNGFVAIPIWGFYEGVSALAVQGDGKIIVAGGAADPTFPFKSADCYPYNCGSFATVVRLLPDGSMDYTFNRTGKTVLQYDDPMYPEWVEVLDDGRIALFSGFPIGRLMPDGSIDRTVDPTLWAPYSAYPLADAQGLWQSADPSRAGWSVAFAQQGETIFATIQYTDTDGTPRWLVVPEATRTWAAAFKGKVYKTRGPWFGAHPYDPSKVSATAVGDATIEFIDHDHGSVLWTMNGAMQLATIVRRAGPDAGCAYGSLRDLSKATNYTDMWWNPSESGWGLHLAHAADRIIGTWLTYDADNEPTWFQGEGPHMHGDYQGDLYSGSHNVGLFNIEAADGNHIRFSFSGIPAASGDRITVAKEMTRQIFRAPGTSCR